MLRILAAVLFAAFASAAPSPGAAQIAEADRALALDDAFARLKEAATPEAAERAEEEVWALWTTGPTTKATADLAAASALLRQGRSDEAHARLDALLAEEPEFMEAWNQRAFAKFLKGDVYGSLKGDVYGSLTDIDEVLKREPRHFGALAGRARIESRIGRPGRAMRTMGEVGAIHPWMARRSAIPAFPAPAAPDEKPGEAL